MADLGRKWSNFRYHGNKGRPSENLNRTINSAVHENPLFGAHSAALAFVQAELWPIWVENGRNFKNQYLKEYLTDLHQTSTALVLSSRHPITLLELSCDV